MKPGKKTRGIADVTSGVTLPVPGQTGFYVCHECGNRFTHKIPHFSIFGVKCPGCGSYKTARDPFIVH